MSFSNDEVSGVYTFLRSTPEAHLKEMLVSGPLSEVHFRLLVKIAKSCSEPDFVAGFEGESFPGVRLKPPEIKIQEGFWAVCKERLSSLGFLSPPNAQAA